MGKSKTKNIDLISSAELDKLLDKHGSGKFSPTPQEHYMYYFGSAFVTVLLGSYIFASGRFASVATDNLLVTLIVLLIGAGGLAVSYDKHIQDQSITALDSFFNLSRGSQSMSDYLTMWRLTYEEAATQSGLVPNNVGKSYLLLQKANISSK